MFNSNLLLTFVLMKRKTLFIYNNQIIHECEFDLYDFEMINLKQDISIINNIDIDDIELKFVNKEDDNLSKLIINKNGLLTFVDLENYPVNGVRLTINILDTTSLYQFLDKVVNNNIDENLVFTI